MREKPMIQLALDDISFASSIRMAVLAGPYADVIEIGGPLNKCVGTIMIKSVRELLPDKLILADYKSPDAGSLEAKIAHESGANLITVIGSAPKATIQSSLDYTLNHDGIETVMELTGVTNIIEKAIEWRGMGIERITYHLGFDEEHFDRKWSQSDLDIISELIDMGYKVTVTGGINHDLLPFFKDLDISIFICGRSIIMAEDPVDSIIRLQERVSEIWS